jgi:hypothetical protein
LGKITLQHEIQQQQQPRSKVNSYLNFTQKLTYVWVYFLIFFLKMFINEMRSVLFFPLFSNDSSCLACVPVWLRWMHLIMLENTLEGTYLLLLYCNVNIDDVCLVAFPSSSLKSWGYWTWFKIKHVRSYRYSMKWVRVNPKLLISK